MIQIDSETCTGCGLCAEICHESCITLVDGRPLIETKYCSTCSQCVAICPVQALSWNGVAPVPFDPARLPAAAQLDELYKQRRSVRRFQERAIERALLAEIVHTGIYAPTHNYSLRAIVVDDASIVQALDRILMRFVSAVYKVAYQPRIIGWLAHVIGMEEEYLLNKPKVEGVVKRGYAFRHPPAIIFVVGDRRIPLSVDSAQYALANMTFYAQVNGIAGCLWGNGPIFISRSPAARRLLGLGRHDRIFGALFLGYPAVRFRNKVEGRQMPIQFL